MVKEGAIQVLSASGVEKGEEDCLFINTRKGRSPAAMESGTSSCRGQREKRESALQFSFRKRKGGGRPEPFFRDRRG